MKIILILFVVVLFASAAVWFVNQQNSNAQNPAQNQITDSSGDEGEMEEDVHPLSIQALRNGEYPGSDIVIEQKLDNGVNYERFIASYKSEGLKIYALLTIPIASEDLLKPEAGWPVIVFNHGYIPPAEYRTTERYIAYTDAFSRSGYILLRPDYRGHGNSEGQAAGGYGSNAYTIDVLNAVASIKRFNDRISSLNKVVDPERIGMWGHSMGGHITLRNMVANKDVKAGVIWAGVVASYPDLLSNWRRGGTPRPTLPGSRGGWRVGLTEQYGTPEENPEFWNSISATSYLSDISGPLQLHHGTADSSVPVEFSEKLAQQMESEGREVEIFIYQGDDHNIAQNLFTALERSVEFFDKNL